ncbi:pyrroloquinoline quinone precursor peptide PqqA [bacterium SCSIO 12741]|nr:pyrroloquinoline quinone precursor peptide PqqA [bacterium SCSIO 12741]
MPFLMSTNPFTTIRCGMEITLTSK